MEWLANIELRKVRYQICLPECNLLKNFGLYSKEKSHNWVAKDLTILG